jgi:hypothetical protein
MAPLSPACDTGSCNSGAPVLTPVAALTDCGPMGMPAADTCDGAGHCDLAQGQPCTIGGATCESGDCVNGYCCNSACGECKSCGLTAHHGTCTDLAAGSTDNICMGNNACDGLGNCKSNAGQPCATASTCLSGFCADGVCCGTACGECSSCDLANHVGTCELIPAGTMDPTNGCMGNDACDGMGNCKSVTGQPCAAGNTCVSGFCADDTCCATACGECSSCALAGHVGACELIPSGTSDPANGCTGMNVCNGAGTCVGSNGAPCTPGNGATCLSNNCSNDSVCCAQACAGTCEECGPSGAACSPVPEGTTSRTCNGNSACDGADHCLAADGQPCSGNGSCANGNCSTDGVCCATPCSGACDVCAPSGGTTCGDAAAGAKGACGANMACNATGTCEAVNGQPCTTPGADAACESGFCSTDKVCCATACSGTCQVCEPSGGATCANAAVGVQDGCGAMMACNAAQQCEAADGQTCATAGNDAACASGFCSTDLVCCATSCSGACQTCGPSGTTCANVATGSPGACGANMVCSATQQCVAVNGQACTSNPQCESGNCNEDNVPPAAGGFCCPPTCTGPCKNCTISGNGTCSNFSQFYADPNCGNGEVCNSTGSCELADGQAGCGNNNTLCASGTCTAGTCKGANGQPCTSGTGCTSTFCPTVPGGLCCNSACNAECALCPASGMCGNAPQLATDPQGICPAGSACDGGGTGGTHCKLADGQSCTTGPTGDGQCASGHCPAGTCVSFVGQPCSSGTDCGLGICSPVAPQNCCKAACGGGQACDTNGNCNGADGQTCSGNGNCASGTCSGGTCVSTSGQSCLTNANCQSGTCLAINVCL